MSDLANDPEERVRWVYASATPNEVRDRYDAWAAAYDSDLTGTYDYVLPQITVADFTRHVPPGARTLDAGAGTGLVAAELAKHGYTDVVGMDISPGMLAIAEQTGLYASLHEMDLGDPLGFADDEFDAVVSVGTFTDGHAPPAGLIELTRVTRPGGWLIIAIRDDIIASHGFDTMFDGLIEGGRLELVELTDPKMAMPKAEPDVLVQSWCLRVL